MNVHINYTLKEPKKEELLLYVRCRWNSNYVKVSTRQQVIVATWDNTQQLCITSKEKFTDRTNRQSPKVNKFLKELSTRLTSYFNSKDFDYDTTPQEIVKSRIQGLIEVFVNENKSSDEKKRIIQNSTSVSRIQSGPSDETLRTLETVQLCRNQSY